MICSEHLGLRYYPDFLKKKLADHYFKIFANHLDWQIEHYRIFGKTVPSPRLIAWYGNEGLNYRYSGIEHLPLAWTKELIHIKNDLETSLNHHFNSVLANLYRDGRDSMGWHADDEQELGQNPVIASLSLGAARFFSFRSIQKPKQTFKIPLAHGSLIVMDGATQHHWQHAVLKTTKCLAPRINLTFRLIKK